MAAPNEYTGRKKLGIIAALCAVFSIWLMIASKIVLTAIFMCILAALLFKGFKAAKYIFIFLQITRGAFALLNIINGEMELLTGEAPYYILYFIYAVASIIMLLFDKDIKEFYR